jgi:hypothetical protein
VPLPTNQTNVEQCENEEKRGQNCHSRLESSPEEDLDRNKLLLTQPRSPKFYSEFAL